MSDPYPPPTLPGASLPALNLGILAHVDAGKTSLTERLLYFSGATDRLGSVDDGTSRTDSMDIERSRGITVRTNVASFALRTADGVRQVNQIDTPGHSDFIAEVERSLAVLDAAVLVVSAVEGVQPQTVVLWRAIRRLGLPAVVFLNKVDRVGADPERVLAELRSRLADPAGVGMVVLSRALGIGQANARVSVVDAVDDRNVEVLADHDQRVLADAVEHESPDRGLARNAVQTLWADGTVVPVLAGSALTGAGVDELITLLGRFPASPVGSDELSAVVFKIENDDQGRTVWARVFSGVLRVRDRLPLNGPKPERVTGLWRSAVGGPESIDAVGAGDVVRIRGLSTARVGDWLGVERSERLRRQFALPTLESVVEPVCREERGRMYAGLTTLAEQDPLINVRIDDDRDEIAVSLYGEVQKEVIGALLHDQFGVTATFAETTTVQIERIRGTGSARAAIRTGDNPYLATLGVRVEPAPIDAGVLIDLEVELGSMPASLFAAAREGIRAGLAQGRYGWRIPDARVVITDTGYAPRQSHMHQKFNKDMSTVASDFRHLAPVLVHQSLDRAGTVVCEPVDSFTLETTANSVESVLSLVARLEGVVRDLQPTHDRITLSGTIPVRQVRPLVTTLPDLTRGEALFTVEHDHFTPVSGPPPVRRRVGVDPLDSTLWFRAHPR